MSVLIQPPSVTMNFVYGDECIRFERVKRASDAQRILIKLHPDCRVVVAAPESASNDAVFSAVKKRGRWIYEKLRDFRKQFEHSTPCRYVSSENHYYLGKQYLLKVVEITGGAQGVKLLRGKLEVSVRERRPEKVQRQLMDWLCIPDQSCHRFHSKAATHSI